MEKLHNGFILNIPPEAFPLSTDSMALSGFVRLPKNARVLDLGSGAGTLGLLLCASDPSCSVLGIELSMLSHLAAEKNATVNHIEHRLTSICADVRDCHNIAIPGHFDCVVTNPPYFSGGPESVSHPTARQERSCTLADFVRQAARALKHGGDFYTVYRPERLGELIGYCTEAGLEPKRLCLLRHKKDSPISLVLLSCRRGGKPGLLWEEAYLQEADGSPSPYYRALYHL